MLRIPDTSRPVKTTIIVWLAVLFGSLCSAIVGIDMAFNVYGADLKRTFNFTQSQVEIVASTGVLGLGLRGVETFITGTYGYVTTYLISWPAVPVFGGLMSVAAVHSSYFHSRPMAVYIFHLLLSTGNALAANVIGRNLLDIFPAKHTGKLIGLHYAMNSVGKIVFAAEMSLFFSDNLKGFFFCFSIIFIILFGFGYPLLHTARKLTQRAKNQEYHSLDNKEYKLQTSCEAPDQGVSFKHLMCSPFFHATFWPSVILFAAAFTSMNNITFIAESAGLQNTVLTVYLVSVVICVTRLFTGLLFDWFRSETCGFLILIATYLCFGIGNLIGMLSDDTSLIFVMTVLVGVGYGPASSLTITLLVRRFGSKHYSAISGLFFSILVGVQTLLQCWTGYLYDLEIENKGLDGILCYGKSCFYWSFLTQLILTVLATSVQTINWRMTVRNKQ